MKGNSQVSSRIYRVLKKVHKPLPSGKRSQFANWKITVFQFGKSTSFLWAMFNSYLQWPDGSKTQPFVGSPKSKGAGCTFDDLRVALQHLFKTSAPAASATHQNLNCQNSTIWKMEEPFSFRYCNHFPRYCHSWTKRILAFSTMGLGYPPSKMITKCPLRVSLGGTWNRVCTPKASIL